MSDKSIFFSFFLAGLYGPRLGVIFTVVVVAVVVVVVVVVVTVIDGGACDGLTAL